MKIVGCDLHTRYQQIAMLDEETGELVERRLEHASGEAKEFYTNLGGPSPGNANSPRPGMPRGPDWEPGTANVGIYRLQATSSTTPFVW
jgi:hypothetical protein